MRSRPIAKVMSLVTLLACTAPIHSATPSNDGFWVARDIVQGMSEADFFSFVKDQKLTVTYPLKDQLTKEVTVDGTSYWLDFCNNRLTYASWNVSDNAKLLKSIDQRVNKMGFRLSTFTPTSSYSDSISTDLYQLEIRLTKPGMRYSVTYDVFESNSQITLEDTDYDDSLNCNLDPKPAH